MPTAIADRVPLHPDRAARPPLALALTLCALHRCATASRQAADVTILLSRCPLACCCPASSPPAASSGDGSRPPTSEDAWPPTHQDRHTSPYTCRNVALLNPCLPHTSDVAAPASRSRKIQMICSSVIRAFFIRRQRTRITRQRPLFRKI